MGAGGGMTNGDTIGDADNNNDRRDRDDSLPSSYSPSLPYAYAYAYADDASGCLLPVADPGRPALDRA